MICDVSGEAGYHQRWRGGTGAKSAEVIGMNMQCMGLRLNTGRAW